MRGVLLCMLALNSLVFASYLTPNAVDVKNAASHLTRRHESASAKPKLPPGSVTLGMPLASGAFGKVRWGRIGEKTKCVCKSATSSQPHADEYLEMEASMNAILSKAAPFSRHLAPWV